MQRLTCQSTIKYLALKSEGSEITDSELGQLYGIKPKCLKFHKARKTLKRYKDLAVTCVESN